MRPGATAVPPCTLTNVSNITSAGAFSPFIIPLPVRGIMPRLDAARGPFGRLPLFHGGPDGDHLTVLHAVPGLPGAVALDEAGTLFLGGAVDAIEAALSSGAASDAELVERRKHWVAPPAPTRGYQKLYVEHVQQAHLGADLDFLVGKSGADVPRDSH